MKVPKSRQSKLVTTPRTRTRNLPTITKRQKTSTITITFISTTLSSSANVDTSTTPLSPASPPDPPRLSPTEAAFHNQTSVPFLSLSPELQTEIILHLSPREAIFLSLTCRDLHHGVLSAKNYYLWYKVGRFNEGLPGYYVNWKEDLIAQLTKQFACAPPEQSSLASTLENVNAPLDDRSGVSPSGTQGGSSTASSSGKGKGIQKPKTAKVKEEVMAYDPQRGLDYRRFLVDTMLGLTVKGCQWCLKRPLTKKWYAEWKVRLCEDCFHGNMITIHAVRKLDIDISHLPVQIARSLGGSSYQGLWKPSVRRLILARYGPERTLEDLLREQHELAIQAKHKAEEALWDYRNRQRQLVWARIQQVYTSIGDGTITGHEELQSLQKKYIPLAALKLEWFLDPIQPYVKGQVVTKMSKSERDSYMSHYAGYDPCLTLNYAAKSDQPAGWVNQMAWKGLRRFEYIITKYTRNPCVYWSDAPMCRMLSDCKQLAVPWYLELCRKEELEERFNRAVEMDPEQKGFVCPLRTCYGVPPPRGLYVKPRFQTLERYVSRHMRGFHDELLMKGEVRWLKENQWLMRHGGEEGTKGEAGPIGQVDGSGE